MALHELQADSEDAALVAATVSSTMISEILANMTTATLPHKRSHDRGGEIIGWAEFGAFLVGTPMNIFVIYLCLTLLRRKACNNQWIVLSMTVADLLFTLIHCPLMFDRYAMRSSFNQSTCMFMYIVTYLSTIGSSLSLLLLNIDKFIYIHKPLHYFVIMTKTRTFIGIGVCWTISLAWTFFFILGPSKTKGPPYCDFYTTNISLYVVFLVLFFMLPVLLSLLISVYIALIVMRTTRANQLRRAQQQSISASSYASHSSKTNGSFHSNNTSNASHHGNSTRLKSRLQSQLRSIVFVFSTTIWSALSSLPYRFVYSYVKTSELYSRQLSSGWYSVSYGLFILVTMNAVLNPVITIVTQKSYVEAVRSLLPCVASAKRHVSKSSVTMMTSVRIHNQQNNNNNGHREADAQSSKELMLQKIAATLSSCSISPPLQSSLQSSQASSLQSIISCE